MRGFNKGGGLVMSKTPWERLTIKQRQELSEILNDLITDCEELFYLGNCDTLIRRHGKETCPIYRLFTFFGWTPYCEDVEP